MDIYKRFGISDSFLDAIQSVNEKKALDPVDPKQAKGTFDKRKDKDIDNDGDADKTDKYLHTRRNAITKAMSEKKKGGKDKIDTEPKIDDKGDMRGVQEAERRADVKMVKVRNADGTMSFRKERPEIKVEEVEELDELSPGTLGRYVHKRNKQAPARTMNYQMAPDGYLKDIKKYNKKVDKGVTRALNKLSGTDVTKKPAKTNEGVKSGLENPHNCATHVYSEQWGEGSPIKTMHADPDEVGQIAWYDVMFDHGIERQVPIEELKVVKSEMHNHSKKK